MVRTRSTRFSSRTPARAPTPTRRAPTRTTVTRKPVKRTVTKRTVAPARKPTPVIAPAVREPVTRATTTTRVPTTRVPTTRTVTKRTPAPARKPTQATVIDKKRTTPIISSTPKPTPVVRVPAPEPRIAAAPQQVAVQPAPKKPIAPKREVVVEGGGPSFIGGVTTGGAKPVEVTREQPKVEPRKLSPQEEIVQTQAERRGDTIFDTQTFAREGVDIAPESLEGQVIQRTIEEQDVARQVNLVQKQRFDAITGAKSGVEALEIARATPEPEAFFTFGGPAGDTRGALATAEGQALIEERLRTTPRPSLQESLGFGIPQPKATAVQVQAELKEPESTPFGPAAPVEIQEAVAPESIVAPNKTVIKQDAKGNVTVKTDIVTPDTLFDPLQSGVEAKETNGKLQVKGVPFVPGVPGLIGGVSLFAAGANQQKTINTQPKSPTGFFIPESDARAQALSLEKSVLSETRTPLPTESISEVIPAGEPKTSTRTFVDPRTGLLTTETVTTKRGEGELITQRSGEQVTQQVGLKPVKTDVSDPVGSLFQGVRQEIGNEVIGITGLFAQGEKLFARTFAPDSLLAREGSSIKGRGKVLEDALGLPADSTFNPNPKFFATPSAIALEGGFAAGGAAIEGRDARAELERSGQQLTRTAEADPFFTAGAVGTTIATFASPTKIVRGVQGLATRVGSVLSKRAPVATQLGSSRLLTRVAPKTAEKLRTKGTAQQAKARLEKLPVSKQVERSLFQTADAPELIAPRSEDVLFSGAARGQSPTRQLRIGESVTRLPEERLRPTPRTGKEPAFTTIGETQTRVPLTPQGPTLGLGGVPTTATRFPQTTVGLGRATTQVVRRGDDFDDIFRGGGRGTPPPKPPTPPKAPKVTQKQIDELSKRGNVSKKTAEAALKKQAKKVESTGDDTGFRLLTTKSGLTTIQKSAEEAALKSARLNKLQKARAIVAKTKGKPSTKADQQTQRALSNLIKKEKKLTPDKLTQSRLRKLIGEERVTAGIKALSKGGKKADDIITRSKPKTTPIPRPRPKSGARAGTIAGGAAGIAIGGALLQQPQATGEETIPRVSEDQIFRPGLTETTITRQPLATRQRDRFTELFDIRTDDPTVARTRTVTRQDRRLRQQQALTQRNIFNQQFLRFGRGPRFAEGQEKEQSSSSARRFFRVFDVARTPFGRVERGLGTQVQSRRAIFEISDVLGRAPRRNVNDRFFDISF